MEIEAVRRLRDTALAWSYVDLKDPWYKAQQVLEDWLSSGSIRPTLKQQAKALEAFELARKKVGAQSNMPRIVYRGLVIKRSMLKRAATTGIELKPRYLSSWTGDPMVARDYAWAFSDDKEIGIILSTTTAKNAILYLDASTLTKLLGKHGSAGSPKQKEVVMKGNGVKRIDGSNLLAIVDHDGKPQKVEDYLGDSSQGSE